MNDSLTAIILLVILEFATIGVMFYVMWKEENWPLKLRAQRRRYLSIAFIVLALLFALFMAFGGTWVLIITVAGLAVTHYWMARRYNEQALREDTQ